MKPLFQVGESVVIQSKNYPEFNNREDVIEQVIDFGEGIFPRFEKDVITNETVRTYSRFAYVLQYYKYREGDGFPKSLISMWGEPSLRKKHKPSDDSFESMMTKLKTSIKSPQKLSEKSS